MKQVLLLGDSIRMQYQPVVGKKLADIAEVSGPEDNGRWSGYTLNSLRFWLPHLPSKAQIWSLSPLCSSRKPSQMV